MLMLNILAGSSSVLNGCCKLGGKKLEEQNQGVAKLSVSRTSKV